MPYVHLRLNAERTFPPRTPSPPYRRGGGAKITFVYEKCEAGALSIGVVGALRAQL